jgi:hypothetical protein
MAEADLLVHVHIPKCAGTSIWYWMARHMPSAHGFLYPDTYPSFYYDVAALEAMPIQYVSLRCMSSHYFRVFPAICAGRRMRYFTLLRDPVRQFVSYVRYQQINYSESFPAEARAALPPHPDQLELRDVADWILSSPNDIPERENYQSNFLASYEWRTRTGRGPQPGAPSPVWAPEDWAAYRSARPALAKEVLDGFAVVGVVERFAESLELLVQRARSWDVTLGPLSDIGTVNVTEGEPDLAWIDRGDTVGRKLLDSVAEDYELYAHAVERLNAAQ